MSEGQNPSEVSFEPFCAWFTGPPASGKSTLGERLAERLRRSGARIEILDGDALRSTISSDLGFTKDDRDEQVRRVTDLAAAVMSSGASAIVALVSPYRVARNEARARLVRFCEIHVTCPFDELVRRDPKDLYRRALAGEVRHVTGVDDPYEPPLSCEATIDTSIMDVDEAVTFILDRLIALGLLAAQRSVLD